MTARVSIKEKRREAPAWVFVWKPLGRPLSARLLPFILAASLFLLALVSLRVQVTPPKPWNARKGSLIHAVNNAEGRALAMRARDGGPFPSRFDLSDWPGTAALEQDILRRAVREPAPYVPTLRSLGSDPLAGDVALSAPGLPVLPRHPPDAALPASPTKDLQLVPVLRGLSGIRPADIPTDLPAFDPTLAAKLSLRDWRFLVRLDASGRVAKCVALSGEDDAALADWLAGVSFQSKSAKAAPRWIAVQVGFINRVVTDGTGNR